MNHRRPGHLSDGLNDFAAGVLHLRNWLASTRRQRMCTVCVPRDVYKSGLTDFVCTDFSTTTAASRTPPWLASGWECRGRRPSRVYGGPVLGAWSKSTLGNLSTASRKVGQAHKPSLCTAALAFSSVVCEIRMAERPQASPLQSHELQLTW